jgi:tripartite-type tricarboxylate transporter receptor subunit TctC
MLRALVGLSLLGILASPSVADNQTTKQIRIVVPWLPGGSADLVGRLIANYLSANLGQTVFVDNRPGASGMIGSALVAKAEPDGATYVISGIPSHVIAPAMAAEPLFDPRSSAVRRSF